MDPSQALRHYLTTSIAPPDPLTLKIKSSVFLLICNPSLQVKHQTQIAEMLQIENL